MTPTAESGAIEVTGYDYDAERDRRWREIVDRFCVLDEKNEADSVVPRLIAAGCRHVLEVGSHWGPVSERVASGGGFPVCLELDPEVVQSAHKPAVRATAATLPFRDESFDAITALNVLYFLERPEIAVAEARRTLRPDGTFIACAQMRDNDPELREVAPGWGAPASFDGDNAEGIVRAVFDAVEVEPWDVVAYRLPTTADVVDYVEVFYKLPRGEAERRTRGLEGPINITKKGLFLWATKG